MDLRLSFWQKLLTYNQTYGHIWIVKSTSSNFQASAGEEGSEYWNEIFKSKDLVGHFQILQESGKLAKVTDHMTPRFDFDK